MKRSILLLVIIVITSMTISDTKAQQCNANFTFTQDSGFVQFTNTSTAPAGGFYSYWYFGDNGNSSDINPSHEYTSTGTFYATLYISANDSSCWDTLSVPITITTLSTANICNAAYSAFSINNDSLHMQFTNQSTSTHPLTYQWNFGDGNTSALANPSHAYQQPGSYNVCLTVTNSTTSCTDTYCNTHYVQYPPCFASFYYSIPQPGTYNFMSNSTGQNLLHLWNFGDGNTSSQVNPAHTYASSGSYNVTLTITSSTDSSCSSQYNATINVSLTTPNCQASFYMFQDSVDAYQYYAVNTSSGPNIQYFWDFGDGTIDSTQYPTHTYQDSMNHVICLTVFNSNCQDTQCDTIFTGRSAGYITISVIPAPVGVLDAINTTLNVFPNPAQDQITLTLEKAVDGILTIRDVTGRVVLSKQVSATEGVSIKTDLSMLSKGTYILNLTGQGMVEKHCTIIKN